MKTTIVEFEVITREDGHKFEYVEIEHNFNIIPSFTKNGIKFPETSIGEQVIEMLDRNDDRT